MRALLTIILLTILRLVPQAQAVYYVDKTLGSDGNTGTAAAPWQTLNKVNTSGVLLIPDVTVRFKCGEVWHEALIPPSSGTSGHPIRFATYGAGAKPKFTGLTTLGGWTSVGTNLWEAAHSTGSRLNVVIINNLPVAPARWPNFRNTGEKGYQVYTTGGQLNQLTDPTLTGTPNWTGGEVVVRTTPWEIDRSPISSQSTTVLNFGVNLSDFTDANNGYFVQNHLSAIDTLNEWMYTTTPSSKITMYSVGNPGSIARASNIEDIITVNAKSYLVFDSLEVEGADRIGIFVTNGSAGITIRNCKVMYSGENGISNWANYSFTTVSDLIIDSNVVRYSYSNGIYFNYFNPTANINSIQVIGDTVINSGFLPGIGQPGGDQYDGIYVKGLKLLIRRNYVDSCGSSGITHLGKEFLVDSNFVGNWNMWTEDIGGIYTSHVQNAGGNWWDGVGPREVYHNFVINGGVATAGLWNKAGHTRGLYCDEPSDHVIYKWNTAANMNDAPMEMHRTNFMTISYNTLYNGAHQQSWMGVPNANNETFTGQYITGNIFAAKNAYQHVMDFQDRPDDVPNWQANGGLIDSNYLVNPFRFPVWSHHSESISTTRFWEFVSWRGAYPTMDAHTTEVKWDMKPYTGVSVGANQATSSGFGPNANYNNSIGIGAVTAGTIYRVRLTASAAALHSTLDCIMYDFGPNQEISEHQFVKMSATPITDTFYLVCNKTTSNAVIYMYLPGPIVHTVSGAAVEPLTSYTAVNIADSVIFDYNITMTPKVVNPPGTRYWKDVKGNRYPDTYTIPPYQSILLRVDTGVVSTNLPPLANAGIDRTITWPVATTSSSGVTDSDPDGTISTRLWSFISGPNTPGISSPGTAATNFTGLTVGSYLMKYTVTDNLGAQTSDTMQITVNVSVAPKIAAMFKANTFDLRGSEGEGASNYYGLVDGLYDPKNGTTSRGGADAANLNKSVHAQVKLGTYHHEVYGSEADFDLKINYDMYEVYLYEWGNTADSVYVLSATANFNVWDTLVRYRTTGVPANWGWKRFIINKTASKLRVAFRNTPYDGTDTLAEITEMVVYGNPATTVPTAPSTVYTGLRQATPTVGEFVWVNSDKMIDTTRWLKPFGGVRLHQVRPQVDTARLNAYPVKAYRENFLNLPVGKTLKDYSLALKALGVGMYVSTRQAPQYIQSSGGNPFDHPTDVYGGPGLKYKYYEGPFSTLPNFSSLTPKDTGYMPNFEIHGGPYAVRPDSFAYVWEGYINIPAAGTWTFETRSDDGSKLYFNSFYSPGATALVNNDGLHPPISQTGDVIVNSPGKYPFAVTYFEADRGDSMQVYWTGPGVSRQLIPNSAFSQLFQDARNKENFKTDSMYFNHKAKLYGATTHPLGNIYVSDMTKFTGIDAMRLSQPGNDGNDWAFPSGYEDPVIAAARAIKVYGGIKAADVNSSLVMPSLTKLDTAYLKDLYYALGMLGDTAAKKYHSGAVAYHNFVFNGQDEFPASNLSATGPTQMHGELPEKWGMLSRYRKVREATYRIAGNVPMFIDEIGWSRNPSSPYNVPLLTGRDAASSQGVLLVKSLNYGMFAGVDKMAIYWLVNTEADGGGSARDAMGLFDALPPTSTGLPFKSYYWVATYCNILRNFKPVSMDTSGAVWKFKYVHKDRPDSAAWFIAARDTGTVVTNYSLATGQTTSGLAKIINFSDTRDSGVTTFGIVFSGVLTLATAGYAPQLILTEEGAPPNLPPVVSAGPDKSVTLPTSSVSVAGTATDDVAVDHTTWTQQSGPSSAGISTPAALTTNITGLIEGTYVFRLTAYDVPGLSAYDEVTVTVGSTAAGSGVWRVFRNIRITQ